jgi:hypothetical protein
MNIQYLGFEQDLNTRTYVSRVVESLKPDREFQLSIDTQLVSANKFKLQDIPDLCFAEERPGSRNRSAGCVVYKQ